MAGVNAMRHFSGLACRVVRIRPWRDSRERWRQHIAPAGLSGAAVDEGCDASVMAPPLQRSAPVSARLEQCRPVCARATSGSKLGGRCLRARGIERAEQCIRSGACCDSKQEACSEVAKQEH